MQELSEEVKLVDLCTNSEHLTVSSFEHNFEEQKTNGHDELLESARTSSYVHDKF